ncbi:MAG: hypothetical protein ACI9W4_002957, partial [Rhodothermales bacterium]
MIRLVQVLCCGLLVCGGVRAQAPLPWHTKAGELNHPWTYTSFTESAGLEGQFVFDITFDIDGRLWVASAEGLLAFDGLTWRRFTEEDGLPSRFVRSVLADDAGQIWAGTDKGLAIGDINGFSLNRLQPSAANIRRLRRAPDGSIWICSDSWLQPQAPGGLAILGKQSIRSVQVPEQYVADVHFLGEDVLLLTTSGVFLQTAGGWTPMGNSAELGYPRDVARDYRGVTILSTEQGTYEFVGGSWNEASTGLTFKRFRTFIRDGEDLFVVDLGTMVLKRWNGDSWIQSAGLGGAMKTVDVVAEAPDGARWFAAPGLLVRFGPSRSWITHEEVSGRPVEDTADRLWIEASDAVFRLEEGHWRRILEGRRTVVSREPDVAWIWNASELVRVAGSGDIERFSARSLGLPRGLQHFDTNSSGMVVAQGP